MYNNTTYNRELISEVSKGYLIGKLASNDDNLPLIGYEKKPITIMKNSNGAAVTYIKPLCEDPEYFKKHINPYIPCSDVYINLDFHNSNINLYSLDYTYQNDEDKIRTNQRIFENKIIIFKPNISIDGSKIHKNVSIVKLIDNHYLDLNSKYVSIPIVKSSVDEFEFKLYKEDKIIINDGVKACCQNEYVLCGNRFYGVFDGWYKAFGSVNSWMCEGKENVTFIDLDFNSDEFKKNVLIVNDEIAFISLAFLHRLDDKLMTEGNVLNLNRFADEYYSNTSLKDNLSIKEVAFTDNSDKNIKEEVVLACNTSSQLAFLNKFKEITNTKGLSYNFEDLVNFHISLKTSPLTIVAGMTGTGKTQIAKCYADLLGLNQSNGKLLFLPISPSYTEPEDVLGFLNTTTGLYTPSETGLVDLLIRANNDVNGVYMVIFDEMNLSQIEHWFAPFLSLLELSVEDRNLYLYGEGQICHNSAKYPSLIKIPENVLFVGTVNLDETTKDFSDRVLDRANVISLNKKKFLDIYFEDSNQENSKIVDLTIDKIDYSTFSSWIKQSKGVKGFNENEVLFLDSLDELLTSEDSQKGISFRMLNKISSYIENIPENIDGKLLIDRRTAFDLILLQRLLPRLRGTERQLDGLLCSINSNTDNSPLYEAFNSGIAKDISDFYKVKRKIKEKEKDLEKYGYAN